MINKTTIKLLFIAAALFLVPQTTNYAQNNKNTALDARQKSQTEDDFSEQEEVRRTFKLSPGASVEVSTIYGAVDIETSNTDTAEIHIIRYARNRADFSSRKINIEQTANGLAIRGERDLSQEPYKVRHRVLLKLPRRISLFVEKVNARVNIGDIDGAVRLERINGAVKVARAAGSAEISNINGSFTMTITKLGERGIRAEEINGSVELRFTDDLNANLNVIEFNGSVNSELPNTSVIEKKRNEIFAARIGTGGVPISLTSINGGIRLSRVGSTVEQ
ncbi:MAG: hypothetical protein ACR2MG_11115 [Pyrinomonadaceae bacterium]